MSTPEHVQSLDHSTFLLICRCTLRRGWWEVIHRALVLPSLLSCQMAAQKVEAKLLITLAQHLLYGPLLQFIGECQDIGDHLLCFARKV